MRITSTMPVMIKAADSVARNDCRFTFWAPFEGRGAKTVYSGVFLTSTWPCVSGPHLTHSVRLIVCGKALCFLESCTDRTRSPRAVAQQKEGITKPCTTSSNGAFSYALRWRKSTAIYVVLPILGDSLGQPVFVFFVHQRTDGSNCLAGYVCRESSNYHDACRPPSWLWMSVPRIEGK